MRYEQVETFDETTEVAPKKGSEHQKNSTTNFAIHGESNSIFD
jgi:hypothetical protein